MIALCGDLVDHGLPEEAHELAREISAALKAKVPVIAVLGNHDFEAASPRRSRRSCAMPASRFWTATPLNSRASGSPGSRGSAAASGDGRSSRGASPRSSRSCARSVDETLKLESALARLRTPNRIALLHYAPIQATVEGEPLEIFPFLGSSRSRSRSTATRLTPWCTAMPTTAARGPHQPNIPVYNVSMSLLQRHFPDRPAFRILELVCDEQPSSSGYAPQTEALTDRIGAGATAGITRG